jgi:hypothetical protein
MINGICEIYMLEWLVAPHIIGGVVQMLSKDKVQTDCTIPLIKCSRRCVYFDSSLTPPIAAHPPLSVTEQRYCNGILVHYLNADTMWP